MNACRVCGLEPFTNRFEWQRDKTRQEVGYALVQHNIDFMMKYCMTCGRYQGLDITGASASRLAGWLS